MCKQLFSSKIKLLLTHILVSVCIVLNLRAVLAVLGLLNLLLLNKLGMLVLSKSPNWLILHSLDAGLSLLRASL